MLRRRGKRMITDTEYTAIHVWVRKNKKKPKMCRNCGSTRRLFWANMSGLYKWELDDFKALCASCHGRMDRSGDPNFCPRGHRMTKSNTYSRKVGIKECKICKYEHRQQYYILGERNRKWFSVEECKIVVEAKKPDRKIAQELGRSMQSIQTKRSKLLADIMLKSREV